MIQGLFSFFLLKKLLKGKSLNIIKPKYGETEVKYWILPHSSIIYEQQTKINPFCGHC